MKLRAAVVGLDKQAIDDHIPGLLSCDQAELVAVRDDNREVLREQQYRLRVAGYNDFAELCKAEQPDFVIVTVPHHIGYRVIEAAIEHGVHVLKEKPFATTIGELRPKRARIVPE